MLHWTLGPGWKMLWMLPVLARFRWGNHASSKADSCCCYCCCCYCRCCYCCGSHYFLHLIALLSAAVFCYICCSSPHARPTIMYFSQDHTSANFPLTFYCFLFWLLFVSIFCFYSIFVVAHFDGLVTQLVEADRKARPSNDLYFNKRARDMLRN